ncbi:TRAP transporter small permease [Paenibacillus alkalitolerans]|uniref:TRAP transporter small permease n=1 Tax=Paenibacillus alkalitolerans TaxID=2799335 RepID=UPI0018F53DBA|nr:TRAP transporter small permease [Paenibacillus alkalitolerans]
MKIFKWIDRTLETACFIVFAALILVVVIQILSRFLPFSFIWTEELARFLFIYGIVLGAPLAIKRKEFVNVDMLINKLPPRNKRFYDIILNVAVILLMFIIGMKGMEFAGLGVGQQSSTMPIPMAVPYASICISAFLMVLYSLHNLMEQLSAKRGTH